MQNLDPATEVESQETNAFMRFVVRFLDAFSKLRQKLTPKIVIEVRQIFREEGFRGVFKRYRWKAVACFFVYYLIRDLTLYVLIPYMIAKGLF